MTDCNEENQEQLPKLYTPKQVAERFGMSPGALRNRRIRGQIEGIQIAENYYMYTEEQINKANLSARKRGPKPKKHQVDQQPEKQVA